MQLSSAVAANFLISQRLSGGGGGAKDHWTEDIARLDVRERGKRGRAPHAADYYSAAAAFALRFAESGGPVGRGEMNSLYCSRACPSGLT